MSKDFVQELFTELATLLDAGIDLVESLRVLELEANNSQDAQLIKELREAVEAGRPLEDAMDGMPFFGKEITSIVRVGSASGQLAEACQEIAQHLEWRARVGRDIRSALTYPIFVLVAIAGLVVVLLTIVVPQFASVFDGLHLTLPLPTRIVLALGEFFQKYWWLVLVALALLLIGARELYRRVGEFRQFVESIVLRVPVIGGLVKMNNQARMAHSLGIMLRAGLPVLDALRLVADVLPSEAYRRIIGSAEDAVRSGHRMSEVLAVSDLFSPSVLRLILVGEESGRLDECLNQIAKRFDESIPRKTKQMLSLLEPLLTLFALTIVGFVAASIFMPMLSLMGGF
ncbi:MAG: type II secretion system F family protein [Pseudomonadota bacterium]